MQYSGALDETLSGRRDHLVHRYIHTCIRSFVVIIGLIPFRLWNIDTGDMLGRMDQNYCWVWSLKFTSDTMVTGTTVSITVTVVYSQTFIVRCRAMSLPFSVCRCLKMRLELLLT